MDVNMESVGDRIKIRRKELQLTQTDIFNMCGIRSGALSRIENGTSVPSVILFYRIAQVLKCDMQWLLTGVSPNMENFGFFKNEESLLKKFRQLPEKDQNEIEDLIEFKLDRAEKEKDRTKSSGSTGTEKDNMIS